MTASPLLVFLCPAANGRPNLRGMTGDVFDRPSTGDGPVRRRDAAPGAYCGSIVLDSAVRSRRVNFKKEMGVNGSCRSSRNTRFVVHGKERRCLELLMRSVYNVKSCNFGSDANYVGNRKWLRKTLRVRARRGRVWRFTTAWVIVGLDRDTPPDVLAGER